MWRSPEQPVDSSLTNNKNSCFDKTPSKFSLNKAGCLAKFRSPNHCPSLSVEVELEMEVSTLKWVEAEGPFSGSSTSATLLILRVQRILTRIKLLTHLCTQKRPVSFIYMALYTVQIDSRQLHTTNRICDANVVKYKTNSNSAGKKSACKKT